MDYFFMSNADEAASRNPILVMIDEETGEKYARAVGMRDWEKWSTNDGSGSGPHTGSRESTPRY